MKASISSYRPSTLSSRLWKTHVGNGIRVSHPSELEARLPVFRKVTMSVDSEHGNAWYTLVHRKTLALHVIEAADPCLMPKAAKNATEGLQV